MLFPDFQELMSLRAKAAMLTLKSDKSVISTAVGDNLSPFRGQGLEFEEVREYTPGDDIRQIDWRVTARTNSPHMKVYREERERSTLLCIDINEAMRFGTKSTFKSVQAARVAALLGWKANASNDKVGCCLYGDIQGGMKFIEPKRSRKSLWQMLKLLSRKEVVASPSPIPLEGTLQHLSKAVSTGSLVYIISDFSVITQELTFQLGSLKRRCDVVLITIDDPADRLIPPIGDIDFKDQKQTASIQTNDKKGQQVYLHQWESTRDHLKQIAAKLGIGIISIATNEDVVQKLYRGLYKVNQRGRLR